jgi:heat shock protein HtpX
MIAATLAGVIMMLARMAYWGALFGGMQRRDDRDDGGGVFGALAMMVLAPIAASLIQLAISRAREYEADATGAHLSHDPEALASALAKIADGSARTPLPAGPATAHLFIVSPGLGDRLARLFSTHPPIEERIRRLRAMAR